MIDSRCIRCNDKMPSFRVNNLCEDCFRAEWQTDDDEPEGYDEDPPICDECDGDGMSWDGLSECRECGGDGIV